MNFCQKHQNHHCVHSHSCQNKNHQKVSQLKKHNHNKTINNSHSHKHLQNKCKFVKRSSDAQKINKQLLAKLHQNQLKICQLAHNQTVKNQKCDKVVLQNKHLFAQIEYYRQQFASLISNNNTDNKNEILKRVQESTDFILKIKILLSQNDSLKVQAQQLRQIIQYYKKQELEHQHKYKSLYEKYQSTLSKLKQFSKYKSEGDQQIINKQKNYEKLHDHYEILKSQFNFQREKSKKQNKQLYQQLEIMKKEFNKYKSLTQKEKQILILQKDSHIKKQQMYKQKLKEFQIANHELKSKLKDFDLRNEELQEDLKFTREVLQKKQEIKGEITMINKQLQTKSIQTFEKKTQIKQHLSHQKNKQNRTLQQTNTNYSQQNIRLKEQIKRLSDKCNELQNKSMSNYQQVIMNMGASEAFKKLILQKNQVIKKLMRQKGAIYAKIGPNYH